MTLQPRSRIVLVAAFVLVLAADHAHAQQPSRPFEEPAFALDVTAGQSLIGFRDTGRSGAQGAIGAEVTLDEDLALRTQVDAGTALLVTTGFQFRTRRREPRGRTSREAGMGAVRAPGGWRTAFYFGGSADHFFSDGSRALTVRARVYLGSYNAGLSLSLGYKWLLR